MEIKDGDSVYFKDGTFAVVLHVYKHEAVVAVELPDDRLITVPISELTTEKPDASN